LVIILSSCYFSGICRGSADGVRRPHLQRLRKGL